jgi:hypothetical protein
MTFSRVSIWVYGIAAALNLWLFLFYGHNLDTLSLALLLGVLIMNQKTIDAWREASLMWQQTAATWRESAEAWRRIAQDR